MNRTLPMLMVMLLLMIKPSSSMMNQDAMLMLANIFVENQYSIDEWQVVMKEKIPRDQAFSYLNQLQETYHFDDQKDENMTKYVTMYTRNDSAITVSYNIIVPHEQNEADMIVVIEGSGWDQSAMDEYRHIFVDIYRHYFTEDIMIFACLSSSLDAIMESVYIFDEFTHKLDLQHIITQSDLTVSHVHKHMMYGYTSLWDTTKLIINDQPINVQIVVQHTENNGLEDTKVTVGTPILINEY